MDRLCWLLFESWLSPYRDTVSRVCAREIVFTDRLLGRFVLFSMNWRGGFIKCCTRVKNERKTDSALCTFQHWSILLPVKWQTERNMYIADIFKGNVALRSSECTFLIRWIFLSQMSRNVSAMKFHICYKSSAVPKIHQRFVSPKTSFPKKKVRDAFWSFTLPRVSLYA